MFKSVGSVTTEEEKVQPTSPVFKYVGSVIIEEEEILSNSPALDLSKSNVSFDRSTFTHLNTAGTSCCSAPAHDTIGSRQHFIKSRQIRNKTVIKQPCVPNENIERFFQRLEIVHGSIFEVYNIYQLYKSILGIPMLCMTISYTMSFICMSYQVVTFIASGNISQALIPTLISILYFFNLLALATLPKNLEEKVSKTILISL